MKTELPFSSTSCMINPELIPKTWLLCGETNPPPPKAAVPKNGIIPNSNIQTPADFFKIISQFYIYHIQCKY